MASNRVTPLIPEQRADKNGRVVTRHVKAGVNHSTKSLPSPALPVTDPVATSKVTGKSFKPTNKQLEQQYYALNYRDYSADANLLHTLEIDTNDFARFSVNHLQFCDVLSVTSPDNAIALMSRDIKTSADALQFLEEQKLAHLIQYREWESDSLLKRKIDPLAYAEMCRRGGDNQSTPSLAIDAAEAQSIKSLREWQRYPTVPKRILDDAMSLEDIKTIGVGRMIRADSTGDALIHSLVMIHKGKVSYTAQDIRTLIDEFSVGTSEIYDMGKMMDMADRFGVDFTKNLFHPDYAFRMSGYLGTKSLPNAKEIIEYADKICRYQSENGHQISSPYADVIGLYDEGISPEIAARGIAEGHSLSQMVGIAKEGIAPSVSGGWL